MPSIPPTDYETVLGTVGFDANGDSTQQMVSFFRVDPAGGRRSGRLGSHQAAGLRPATVTPRDRSARLQRVATCAACGYEAAGPFRFCPQCGMPAGEDGREQRRMVTVLFEPR